MPKKLPARSTFLPSLSIRSIATTEPGSGHTKIRYICWYNKAGETQKSFYGLTWQICNAHAYIGKARGHADTSEHSWWEIEHRIYAR
jgi:hypothetical protein